MTSWSPSGVIELHDGSATDDLFPKGRMLAAATRWIDSQEVDLSVPPGFFVPLASVDVEDIAAAVWRMGLHWPVLVRSAAESEDFDGSLSGILESRLVRAPTDLSAVIEAMRDEAASYGAGAAGAIVQRWHEVCVGAVVGCEIENGAAVTVRAEHAAGSVPVEMAGDGVVELQVIAPGGALATIRADLGNERLHQMIDDAVEVAVAAAADLGLSSGLVEMELGLDTSGAALLFQFRCVPTWAPGALLDERSDRNFGADRNYPVPVGHFTGTFVAPVFTATFGAHVRFDESRQLITDAAELPTPHLRRAARATASAFDLDLDAIAAAEGRHRAWWDELLAWRESVDSTPLPIRASRAISEGRVHLAAYFNNPLWQRCLHVAWNEEPLDDDLVPLVSSLLRSHRSARVFDELVGRTPAELITWQDIVESALSGDDDVLGPTLLDDLSNRHAANQALARRFSSTWTDVKSAALDYRPLLPSAELLLTRLNSAGVAAGGVRRQALAHWYQEADNVFKELVYLTLREMALEASEMTGVSLASIGLLRDTEFADLVLGALRPTDAEMLAARRSAVPPATVVQPTAERTARIIKGTVPSTMWVALGDPDSSAAYRSGLSARDARDLPGLDVLIVGQLGVLAHAANGLRARSDIDLVISGWAPTRALTDGSRLRVDSLPGNSNLVTITEEL